jgi:hypothetical protein
VEPGVNHLVFGKRGFFGYVAQPAGDIWWFANPPRREEPNPAELAAVPADEWRPPGRSPACPEGGHTPNGAPGARSPAWSSSG